MRLRATGLTQAAVAERLGVSRSYAWSLLSDPDGAKDRARRDSYRGKCEDCGAPTDGSGGRAKAPKVCDPCARKRREPEHGTLSRYQGGCPCDACRAANSTYHRSLKGKPVPNHGTVSGYQNYGCRCGPCSAAHSQYLWLRPEYRRRWREKVRGTEPPRHGSSIAYGAYGCRCDECRAAHTVSLREYRRRKRAEVAA